MRTIRPTIGPLALLLALTTLAACSGGHEQIQSTGELQATMDRFTAALVANNTTALAGYFPRDGEWRLQSTLGVPAARSEHTRAEVRQALETHAGLFETVFAGNGDTLRGLVEKSGARDWKLSGPRQFSPPDASNDHRQLFVRWRLERGRWVVDAIGLPFA